LKRTSFLAWCTRPGYKKDLPMLTLDQINTIHQLHAEGWSLRRIERHLHICLRSVRKYLAAPEQKPRRQARISKLDPFKPVINEFLQQDSGVTAAVILQRLQALGYAGGHTVLQEYVRQHRPVSTSPRAFVRMEPNAGERFEVDWGHFGALDYSGDKRKLYAFALVECHSRMLYLEFTHSQSFEAFARCHIHAFHALGGRSREIWYDNLATAVAEHDGRLIRFHPRFLAFAREYGFFPRACNRAAGWEKGKVERVGIGYVRQNFWPLRSFTDLHDVNRQARQWLEEIANQRLHRETRQRPVDRFQPTALRAIAALTPDYRDSTEAFVHKDIRLHFDGNRYCVPPQLVGQRLLVKADSSLVTIYHDQKEIVSYPRCWKRGQTLGADRFEKELLAQRPAASCSQAQRRLVLFLEPFLQRQAVEAYLRALAETDRSLSRQITELLNLIPQYGPDAVASAIARAQEGGAFGADYVANILRQQLCPRPVQPPVRLRDPLLNELITDPLSLLEYDAFILHSRKESSDDPTPETGTTQPRDDESTTGPDPF
jgi:transposase